MDTGKHLCIIAIKVCRLIVHQKKVSKKELDGSLRVIYVDARGFNF